MYTVLLSGGSGKRLWPLSNDLRSKQYIKFLTHPKTGESCSMVQRVWGQLADSGLSGQSVICASQGQVEILYNQLGRVDIAVEPMRRDTFAAVALSCAYLASKKGAGLDEAVCILPVDPYVDGTYFQMLARMPQVLEESGAKVVLMGTKPSHPSDKYGYILPADDRGHYQTVRGFSEKPSQTQAQALIAQGAVWNCGVFCLRIGDILARLERYGAPTDYDALFAAYEKLPKISFDYEVLEKEKNLAYVTLRGMWKDLGSWSSLAEEMQDATLGDCLCDDRCDNTHVINELDIPVVALGMQNAMIVASPDGILVADKADFSSMKAVVDSLNRMPRYEERRWGTIQVLQTQQMPDDRFTTVRKIRLFGGQNSSFHYHTNRDEVWTFLSGQAEVLIEGHKRNVCSGDTLHLPRNTKHAIRAMSDVDFLEVQLGQSIADEDIHRITLSWDEMQDTAHA